VIFLDGAATGIIVSNASKTYYAFFGQPIQSFFYDQIDSQFSVQFIIRKCMTVKAACTMLHIRRPVFFGRPVCVY